MNREVHVGFCGNAGVKLPCVTRLAGSNWGKLGDVVVCQRNPASKLGYQRDRSKK